MLRISAPHGVAKMSFPISAASRWPWRGDAAFGHDGVGFAREAICKPRRRRRLAMPLATPATCTAGANDENIVLVGLVFVAQELRSRKVREARTMRLRRRGLQIASRQSPHRHAKAASPRPWPTWMPPTLENSFSRHHAGRKISQQLAQWPSFTHRNLPIASANSSSGGALFDRTESGDILQRAFGGHTFKRLCHVGDRTASK